MSTNLDIRAKIIAYIADNASRLTTYTTTQWTGSTAVSLNARIRPTQNNYKSRTYKVTTAGTTGATEPSWPTTEGGIVTSGTAIFTEESDSYDKIILSALSLFSIHRPNRVIESITGNGTGLYPFPATWENDFSTILEIEHPTGSIPRIILEAEDYKVIFTATDTWKLEFRMLSIPTSSSFKVVYTIQRTALTIPVSNIEPFIWLCGALGFTTLSNSYIQGVEVGIQADAIDPFQKAEEYAKRALVSMGMYKNFMGIGEIKPASYTARKMATYPGGTERLTHFRR